ncbi:DNA-binding protein [Streptomyces sp. WAC08241]|nr:DNA-binding protein [Streptomyces sp. WAC08241]
MGQPSDAILVSVDLAAYYAGRPESTIRRWANEGRITTHGHGRGKVRYNILELNPAVRDEWTGERVPGETPPIPPEPRGRIG